MMEVGRRLGLVFIPFESLWDVRWDQGVASRIDEKGMTAPAYVAAAKILEHGGSVARFPQLLATCRGPS